MWQVLAGFITGAIVSALAAWYWSLRWAAKRDKKQSLLLERTRRMEKLAELGSLTSGLAHEIRNPLSAIKMNLKLMSEDIARRLKQAQADPAGGGDQLDSWVETYQRYLRKIDTLAGETDRLSEKLNDFLHYAGRLELHPADTDVNELLDDLIDFYEPQALDKGIQVRRTLGSGPAFCRVDVGLIKQALLNLFINAIHAMPSGGALTVRSSVAEAGHICVEVGDSGVGISSDKIEKIFDPFFSTKDDGSGMGLSIAYRIIKEHNGEVQVESKVGKGTRFLIWLSIKTEQSA